MQIPTIIFKDFVQLPDDERAYFEQMISYTDPMPVDCMQWEFGRVKEVQMLIQKGDVKYSDLLDIIKAKVNKQALYLPFHIVLQLWAGINQSIERITKLESDAMAGRVSAVDTIAMEKVGGFERFGRLPEILSLAERFHCDYDKAWKIEWHIAFSTLYYYTKVNEYIRERDELILQQK